MIDKKNQLTQLQIQHALFSCIKNTQPLPQILSVLLPLCISELELEACEFIHLNERNEFEVEKSQNPNKPSCLSILAEANQYTLDQSPVILLRKEYSLFYINKKYRLLVKKVTPLSEETKQIIRNVIEQLREYIDYSEIKNSRQLKQNKLIQKTLRIAQSISDTAELIGHEDSIQSIMHGCCTIIGETLFTDRVSIIHVDFKHQQTISIGEWLTPEIKGLSSTQGIYPLNLMYSGCCYMHEKRQWIESHDNFIHPQLIGDYSTSLLHKKMGIKSLLWYPFRFTNNGYFLIALHKISSHQHWDDADLNFLSMLSLQLDAALETRDKQKNQELKTLDTTLAATAFDSQDAILITDASAIILKVNKAFCDITGYNKEELIGQRTSILRSERHNEKFYFEMWQHLLNKGFWRGEIWNKLKNGDSSPQWQSITSVRDSDGNLTNYIASFQDISERKMAEQRIERLAFYDNLTGLANRTLLIDRLRLELATARRQDAYGALLFLDIDRFKHINDSLGHPIGDRLLQKVARRIESEIRSVDTAARLGGDEFVVALPNLSKIHINEAAYTAQRIAEKIRAAIEQPYSLEGHDYHFTPSIGIALFPEQDDDENDILKHADTAMYKAKSQGGNQIRFYMPEMQIAADERLTLEKDLRQAIANKEFELLYQPQMNNTGRIIGTEALIRWNHIERGQINPTAFIPLAEETGHISAIGRWVLRTAIHQLGQWQLSKLWQQDCTIAINVSPKEFHQTNFVPDVKRLISEAGVAPSRIKLEITESSVIADIEDTIVKMETLKKLGVKFSIDDFGTGYSSLSYLKRLPISQIKIDQSFVKDIHTDPNDAAIVETIISMARHLGLDVIAEGVETQEQLDFLKAQGCNKYQGYFFSRPLSTASFSELLQHDKSKFEATE